MQYHSGQVWHSAYVCWGTCFLPAHADSAGDDWVGQDGLGKPWMCTTGKQQSPINILTTSSVTKALATEQRVTYDLGAVVSNGSNVIISNNGHSVQVTWDQPAFKPGVTITVKGTCSGHCGVLHTQLVTISAARWKASPRRSNAPLQLQTQAQLQ